MILALITFITAILMEGIGSYMSVVGWNSILIGDWVVIALFVVLDLAKIVSISFLYQTWTEIKKTWRAYLVFAVVFLMVLTSAGSFGYLSSSFQQAIQPNKEITLQLQTAQVERTQLQDEKKQLVDSKTKIEDQIAKLPNDSVGGRERLINKFREETRLINNKVAKIDKRVEELNKTVLESSKDQLKKDTHIGPIVYFANAFDIPLEKVVSIAILSIIFVFDPLAMSLVLAGNFLIARHKKHKGKPAPIIDELVNDEPVIHPIKKAVKKEKIKPEVVETAVIVPPEPVVEPEPTVQPPPEPAPSYPSPGVPNVFVHHAEPAKVTPVVTAEKKTLDLPPQEPDKPVGGDLTVGDGKFTEILKYAIAIPHSTETDDSDPEAWKRTSFSHFYSSKDSL
jgi:hypothetical protein